MQAITVAPEAQARPDKTASDRSVIGALSRAAARTGADFGYLLQTAMRESSLDPNAQAPTSSAKGLFQLPKTVGRRWNVPKTIRHKVRRAGDRQRRA